MYSYLIYENNALRYLSIITHFTGDNFKVFYGLMKNNNLKFFNKSMYKIYVYTSNSRRGDYISTRAKYQNAFKKYSYAFLKKIYRGYMLIRSDIVHFKIIHLQTNPNLLGFLN